MTGKKLNKVLALALAIVLSVGLLPTQASAATVTFTDVPTGAWYYADVTMTIMTKSCPWWHPWERQWILW